MSGLVDAARYLPAPINSRYGILFDLASIAFSDFKSFTLTTIGEFNLRLHTTGYSLKSVSRADVSDVSPFYNVKPLYIQGDPAKVAHPSQG